MFAIGCSYAVAFYGVKRRYHRRVYFNVYLNSSLHVMREGRLILGDYWI